MRSGHEWDRGRSVCVFVFALITRAIADHMALFVAGAQFKRDHGPLTTGEAEPSGSPSHVPGQLVGKKRDTRCQICSDVVPESEKYYRRVTCCPFEVRSSTFPYPPNRRRLTPPCPIYIYPGAIKHVARVQQPTPWYPRTQCAGDSVNSVVNSTLWTYSMGCFERAARRWQGTLTAGGGERCICRTRRCMLSKRPR